MKLLENRILTDAKVIGSDVLKVDMFLNHQMDIGLLNDMGKEFHRLFADCGVNKIMTVEASGIGIACIAAQYFSVPVVFAKKGANKYIGKDLYTAEVYSFTKDVCTTIGVSKAYLNSSDRVLIIDDFLANGQAALGLTSIIEQAGATVVGIGIAVEKSFQEGRARLLEKGYNLKSLAMIKSMENGTVTFC